MVKYTCRELDSEAEGILSNDPFEYPTTHEPHPHHVQQSMCAPVSDRPRKTNIKNDVSVSSPLQVHKCKMINIDYDCSTNVMSDLPK